MTLLLQNMDKIIQKCNAPSVREAVGKIISLSRKEIVALLHEFEERPNIRFGDNLLDACLIVTKMRRSQDYSQLF